MIALKGRRVVEGVAEAEALVTTQMLSFLGGVDPKTGLVIERGHELEGSSIAGRVLVFPRGKGSTVGSYTIYSMRRNGTAPKAMVNVETEPIIAAGCALAKIPLVHRLDRDPTSVIKTGDYVVVNGFRGVVAVEPKRSK